MSVQLECHVHGLLDHALLTAGFAVVWHMATFYRVCWRSYAR